MLRPRTAEPRRSPLLDVVVLSALLALAGCSPYLQGNGVLAEEGRSLGPFTGVLAEDGVIVSVRIAADQAQHIVVSGDENLLPELETELEADPLGGKRLRVHVKADHFNPVHPLRVDATVGALAVARVRDESQVLAQDLQAEAFTVEAIGAGGDVTLSGPPGDGRTLDVTLQGGRMGPTLHASGWPVKDVRVALAGGAQAEVRASGVVSGTVASGARLRNHGSGACAVTDPATGAAASCAVSP